MEDLTKKLTTTLAVTLESKPSEIKAEERYESVTEKVEHWEQLLKPVANMDMTVK
jgi:hypothetical protein